MVTQENYTAFWRTEHLATGTVAEIWPVVRDRAAEHGQAEIVVIENRSGKPIDLDMRQPPTAPRGGPGRPRLGVQSREISLLPRHWEWLELQPGGASAALRRLVDSARQTPEERQKLARNAAGRFLSTMAGNFEGFEEASRALYAGDVAGLLLRTAAWPPAVREHALALLATGEDPGPGI